MTRPFKFGIQISTPLAGLGWAETARRVEDLGYHSLQVPDHFGEQYGPITAMALAAAATSELTVGCLVFDNDYRHPVVLAKEMATLADAAPGRVEAGLGAGWMRWDYERAGMAYDAPRVRVDRFEEGLAILKSLTHGEQVSHSGEHYQIDALPAFPRPDTHPRIMIGGGGPRMLRLAVEHADIVAVTSRIPSGEVDRASALDSAPTAVDKKIAWIRAAAGDRIDAFDLNCLTFLAMITDDAEGIAGGVAAMFGSEASVSRGVGQTMRDAAAAVGSDEDVDAEFGAADVLDSPATLLGTVPEVIERLQQRRERWGFNYVTFQGMDAAEAMAPVVAELAGT